MINRSLYITSGPPSIIFNACQPYTEMEKKYEVSCSRDTSHCKSQGLRSDFKTFCGKPMEVRQGDCRKVSCRLEQWCKLVARPVKRLHNAILFYWVGQMYFDGNLKHFQITCHIFSLCWTTLQGDFFDVHALRFVHLASFIVTKSRQSFPNCANFTAN